MAKWTKESVFEHLDAIERTFNKKEFTSSEIRQFSSHGLSVPGFFWQNENKIDKLFSLDIIRKRVENGEIELSGTRKVKTDKKVKNIVETSEKTITDTVQHVEVKPTTKTTVDMYIPQKDEVFVPNGTNFKIINDIVSSNEFFPVYIYGVSGIGKTSSIEYSCAINKRPFFRVQITSETIDDDLIGSMKLVDGNTIWQDGPIISAYRCGGVVVLDEVDLNSNLMILQPVLEKKPFFIKQTGELVHPQEGFTVFATGNTKGDGTDIRFVGTQVLNDAFLDRFGITLYQTFMSERQEFKAAKKYAEFNNIDIPTELIKNICSWANQSRTLYESDPDNNIYISTRRIQFILKAYKIFGNVKHSISTCLARYNEAHTQALIMLWDALDYENNTNASNKQINTDLTQTTNDINISNN